MRIKGLLLILNCAAVLAVPAGAQTDPKGPAMGTARILRGGSWKDVATFIRASYRNGSMAGFRIDDFGVRCAGD